MNDKSGVVHTMDQNCEDLHRHRQRRLMVTAVAQRGREYVHCAKRGRMLRSELPVHRGQVLSLGGVVLLRQNGPWCRVWSAGFREPDRTRSDPPPLRDNARVR